MKNITPIVFITILVLGLYFAYKYSEKNRQPSEGEQYAQRLNSELASRSRGTVEAYEKFFGKDYRGSSDIIKLSYFSCPTDSEIWIATKSPSDGLANSLLRNNGLPTQTAIERAAIVNKNDGQGAKKLAVDRELLLVKFNETGKWYINNVHYLYTNYGINANSGIVDVRGWTWLINNQMLKLVCVKKGQKVL